MNSLYQVIDQNMIVVYGIYGKGPELNTTKANFTVMNRTITLNGNESNPTVNLIMDYSFILSTSVANIIRDCSTTFIDLGFNITN